MAYRNNKVFLALGWFLSSVFLYLSGFGERSTALHVQYHNCNYVLLHHAWLQSCPIQFPCSKCYSNIKLASIVRWNWIRILNIIYNFQLWTTDSSFIPTVLTISEAVESNFLLWKSAKFRSVYILFCFISFPPIGSVKRMKRRRNQRLKTLNLTDYWNITEKVFAIFGTGAILNRISWTRTIRYKTKSDPNRTFYWQNLDRCETLSSANMRVLIQDV